MDIDCPNGYQEFSNMQLKIASLFQDLMKERNNYKKNFESLNVNFKRLSTEVEIIKKENTELKNINNEMRNIICKGVKVFKSVNFSSLSLQKELKSELEILREKFFDVDKTLDNIKSNTNVDSGIETPEKLLINNEREKSNEEEILKEFESIKNLKFTTQFFCEDETETEIENTFKVTENNCKSSFNDLFPIKSHHEVYNENKKRKNNLLLYETDVFDTGEITGNNCHSEKLFEKNTLTKSPVFKEFGVCKQDNIITEGNNCTCESSSKSSNENSGEKSKNFFISPWKMSNSRFSPNKEALTPKRVKRKLKINSPNIQLKKSNSREAEISMSGVRKLTQTLLNVECYKKKNESDWKSRENRENENLGKLNDNIKKESKIKFVEVEEDDFIIESPKKSDQLLEAVKERNKNGNVLNDMQLITPPDTSDADLDETYISSSIVRKCQLEKKHSPENIIEDQTPIKRFAREKSPEYDSVPFVYKREPIRKKAERMKLPGHACLECNKYYENALGDIETQKLQQILNKCSRHRDKNSPTGEETPPGYWKPYLTCSVKISPEKKNT